MSGSRAATGLRIGAAHDPLEAEADRVAQQVLFAPGHAAVSAAPPRIQRFASEPSGTAGVAPKSVEHVLSRPGRALDPPLRNEMQQRFGHDFSRVRVHRDVDAARSARDVRASAYTLGDDIVFGSGRYSPDTHDGRRLIAHELTHVVQQSALANPRRLHRQELDYYAPSPEDYDITVAIRKLGEGSLLVRPQFVMTDLLAIVDKFEYDLRNPEHVTKIGDAVAIHLGEDVLLMFLEHVRIVNSPARPGSGEAYLQMLDRSQRNVLGNKAPGLVIQPTLHAVGGLAQTTANRAKAFLEGILAGVKDGVSVGQGQAGQPTGVDQQFMTKLHTKLLGSQVLGAVFPAPFVIGTGAGIVKEWTDLWALVTNLSETKAAIHQVAEKLFSPDGEALATAMGYDAGLAFVREMRTEVDKSVVEFSYWLGTKIGPLIVDIALSLAGVSVGAIVLKRSLSVLSSTLGTVADFAKYVKQAKKVAPELPAPKKAPDTTSAAAPEAKPVRTEAAPELKAEPAEAAPKKAEPTPEVQEPAPQPTAAAKPDFAKLTPDEVLARVKDKPFDEVKADLEAAGYSVYKHKSGTQVVAVLSSDAKAKGLKSVHVDSDGIVREGPRRGSSNRISSSGLLRRRLLKAIEDANPGFVEAHQAHHLIPDEVARSRELLQVAMERDLFDIDEVSNGLLLPAKKNATNAYEHPDFGELKDLPVHRTSHQKFSERALDEAEDLWNDLTDNGRIDPAQIPDAKIRQAVDELKKSLIDYIQTSGARIQSGPRAGELAEVIGREASDVVV